MELASRRFRAFTLFVAALLLHCASAAAQVPDLGTASGGLWRDVEQRDFQPAGERLIVPERYRQVALDPDAFHDQFFSAPMERTEAARLNPSIVALPLPDGGVARFTIVETAVMAPELGAKFPDIRTWLGQGIDDSTATVRLDWTPQGFHAMILGAAGGRIFIDPYSRSDTTNYISYYTRDHVSPNRVDAFRLPPIDPGGLRSSQIKALLPKSFAFAVSGTQLRTYRLAMAATKEYTNFFGGTVPQAMGAIVTAVNRVNGIYQTEVAVAFQLVANNNLIVRTDANPGSPVYTNNNGPVMLNQNQSNIDAVIGNANYDVGHVFSTGGGGVAVLGVPCEAGAKAQGVTGLSNPTGDGFYVDFVAHEMGHQFGGNHTFNGSIGSCAGGNRNASTAYEPGSGSTIMAYAGICGAQNLQPHSDPYFHSASFDEIVTYTTVGQGNSCPVVTATGNTLPVASVPAGGFTIPANTPFALTGSATDGNGDSLTYNWEEYDLGSPAGPPGVATAAPFFRSWPATSTPTRTFPRLSNLLTNTLPIGEVLPNASRTLNFRMTVRDNRAGGGGVVYGTLAFNVTTAAGPFQVTAPNSAVAWAPGSSQTVTWNVANTSAAPVSCANVNILLSTDGGLTFPTTLASGTPNDGSQSVTLPAGTTTTARIKVACSTSVFFDISNTNFTIGVVPGPSVTTNPASAISQTGATLNGTVSSNGAATTVTFQYGTTTGYGSSAVAAQSPLAAGATGAAVSAAITGLTCNTLYHFRVVGENADGTSNGGDATFTTPACSGVPTTTTLVSSANPSSVGATVTFTASVTGSAPTGTVAFTDNGAAISGCSARTLIGSGNTRSATCATSALTVGSHTIVAAYGGNAGNNASQSSGLVQQVTGTTSGTATIVANPYGAVSVQGATLNGNVISNFQGHVVIQLGTTPGAAGSFAKIDFQGLNLGPGTTLTLRSGASGQTIVLLDVSGIPSAINGSLLAQGGNGAPAPMMNVANPNGISNSATGVVQALSGLTVDTLDATWTSGQSVINDGVFDGGSRLEVFGANIRGGGAYKGNATLLATFGNANNPVNGLFYLSNGLQLSPSSGNSVQVTLNHYGTTPQVFNVKVTGDAQYWMPSVWPNGTGLLDNNAPLPFGSVRPAGQGEPTFGGGQIIVQATGNLTLTGGGTNDFVYPGGIVLLAGGILDLNGVTVNQGWTTAGRQFQGVFLESPNIRSSIGNIQILSNNLNWSNFSTFPNTPVRVWTLVSNPNGTASYAPADSVATHLNTYSTQVNTAAQGGCWTCLINPAWVDMSQLP